MLRKIIIFISWTACLLGCQDIAPLQQPDNLIPELEMEDILYEALLLKSARGSNLGKLTALGIDPQTYILKKFKIDSATFANNIAYYAAQNDTYTAINERIKNRVVLLHKREDSLAILEKEIQDSLRLKRTREAEIERMAKIKEDSINGVLIDTIHPKINQKPKTLFKPI